MSKSGPSKAVSSASDLKPSPYPKELKETLETLVRHLARAAAWDDILAPSIRKNCHRK